MKDVQHEFSKLLKEHSSLEIKYQTLKEQVEQKTNEDKQIKELQQLNEDQKIKFENELSEQKSLMLVKIEQEKIKFEKFIQEKLKKEEISVDKANKIQQKIDAVHVKSVSA